ncbi:methyltransferase domain-containing protein [Puia sp.]|jgi:SAM-dependent methyltransferase|uniref:methyltransferase domain-containing protein n=1 Tax=Puia sp. TaxID=2045100 RepID=UPI002F40EC5F
MTDNRNDPDYWNERWLTGDTGWDMGGVSPPLQHYFQQLTHKDLPILIPGCGNAYEAAWLLDNGFTDITLLDIAEQPTRLLREKFAGSPIKILTADFFQHQGQYHLIVEQTFFCSLDPTLRPAYAEKAHDLLRPGGRLAGLLFDRDFTGGPPDRPPVCRPKAHQPPYGGHKAEYQKLFGKNLTLKTLAPCYNSIKPRAGKELFFIAVRPV